jgi:DNA polymerase-3 subunit alpha
MPDIDTDFSDDRRDEVIRYITQRFGADRVAQISTFGTMAARAAVKDVGRALGIPYGDVDRVAKLIPPKSDLKGALAVPELREMYEHTEYVKRLIDTAQQLEDIKRHNSTHAAGVVISREPLANVTPLVRVGKEGEEGQATQYEFAVLDKIGLLKMDILGLTTLTLIQRTINNVEKGRGHLIDPDDIPLDDPCIYELLSTGETAGIFQVESGGMRKVLRDMKPDRFTDIVAAVALYRPGPMNYIDQYNRRKNGLEPVTYLHPDLEPILEETYGVLVYQDQVLKIAIKLAGYGWGQADILRKAMGKKLPEEMQKQQDAFEEGVKKKGYPGKLAKDIWPLIEVFAGYGFTKSHAAAYAQLACQTAYLKAKYPVEYMAACLSIETGTPDRMAVVLAECRRLGIPILPPDVSHSEMDFAVEGHAVRYALQAVKNVGASAIRSIVEARESGGPFRDLDDFCRRVEWKSLNKRALESLIKAGAMDGLGNRSLLLGNLDRICSHAQRAERAAAAGQASLFDAMSEAEALSLPPLLLTSAPEVPQKKLLAWEKEMLGLYVSEHPLAAFQSESRRLGAVPIRALSPEQAGQRVKVGAQVASMRQIITKKGDTMLVLEIEDLEGTIEAVAFPRTYNRFRELWQEDAILLIDGTVDVRNDRLQLIVEEAAVLERKVSTGAGTLSVYVRRSGDDDHDIGRIREAYLLLRQFPGTDRFELLTDEGGRPVPIPLPGGDGSVCCCPELLERLQALVGPDTVQVIAPAPQPADPDAEPVPAGPLLDAADADVPPPSDDTNLVDAG